MSAGLLLIARKATASRWTLPRRKQQWACGQGTVAIRPWAWSALAGVEQASGRLGLSLARAGKLVALAEILNTAASSDSNEHASALRELAAAAVALADTLQER